MRVNSFLLSDHSLVFGSSYGDDWVKKRLDFVGRRYLEACRPFECFHVYGRKWILTGGKLTLLFNYSRLWLERAGIVAKLPPDHRSAASDSLRYALFRSMTFPRSVTNVPGVGMGLNELVLRSLFPGDCDRPLSLDDGDFDLLPIPT